MDNKLLGFLKKMVEKFDPIVHFRCLTPQSIFMGFFWGVLVCGLFFFLGGGGGAKNESL